MTAKKAPAKKAAAEPKADEKAPAGDEVESVRATTTFHGPDRLTVHRGDVLAGDDPIVAKYPQFFSSADEPTPRAAVVHTATARPGEQRDAGSAT